MRTKGAIRNWRKKRIRKKVNGSAQRPRLSVFRSAVHIYAQIIDDEQHRTLLSVSSLSKELGEGEAGDKTAMARRVGALVAKKCLDHDIRKVVFDRNGFVYHGRIRALADGARAGGLEF